jgi:hypothetical protein
MDYQPLDTDRNEFRLLHLHPALGDEDELSYNFIVALLDETADFEALSYVWGAVTTRFPSISEKGRMDARSRLQETSIQHLDIYALSIKNEFFG